MMEFAQETYRKEMRDLLRAAHDAAQRRLGDELIYTISIWTDPDAAMSAVSIDTREHSLAHIAALSSWAHEQVAKYSGTMENELEEALLNLPDRDINPANFAYVDLAIKRHVSFPHDWAAETDGACWQYLGPALQTVAEEALQLFAASPLDPEAEVGVNAANDWYAARRRIVS
ncbi:MAG TPA: hypothetical protein VJU82_15070, partial [Acidobacteriaceae bacterium]|nr:hypothetical protein [Acidobacteriaceae bacterium]